MQKNRKTLTIVASAALALGLTACGDDSSGGDAARGSDKTFAAGMPSDVASERPDYGTDSAPPASTEPSPAAPGGGTSDEMWAAGYKKAIPSLASTPDQQLVTEGKKTCTTWKANPTPATAKSIVKDAEKSLKLDTMQANMWVGGAMAHFCNEEGDRYIAAVTG